MTAVIQATCPGCKKVLRIPSNWMQQAIRCKHCGLVMAAKQSSAPAAIPVGPAPKKAKDATPVPLAKAHSAAVRPTPLPPTVGRPPVALLASPAATSTMAAPMAVPIAPFGGSPFDNLITDSTADPAPSRRSPAKRGGGWWKGPVIALAVLFLAGVAVAVAWPFVGGQLLPQVAALNTNTDPKDNDSTDQTKPAQPELVKTPDKKLNNPPKTPDKKPNDPPKTPDKKPNNPPKTPDKKPNDPPKTPDKKPNDPPIKKPDTPPAGTLFPRRALVVSVHNYLYANPVGAGIQVSGSHNMSYFVTKLNSGLRIPLSQIAHLSDEAARGNARGPTKQVIEKTLDDFLNGSRDQDRIMVFLIGHAVEIDGEAFFVPIEGELGNAMTLISFKWIYEEMKDCKARQKILVVDTGRFSPTQGIERPGSGPMSAKFDEILKTPPEGVQVWTSCVAEQMSYETDASQLGVFLDKLTGVLEKGIQGTIQHPEDPIPVDKLNNAVSAAMKTELAKFKLVQTPRLTGQEAAGGAAYDAKAEPAKPPVLAASANNKTNVKQIETVLSESSVPPVKGGNFSDATIKFEMLPPFSEKVMKGYSAEEESPTLAEAIRKARAMLWAISTATPPEMLKKDVEEIRAQSKVNLSYLKDGFHAPADEPRFKKEIEKHERDIADMIDDLEHAYKKYAEIEIDRTKEPKRWLANYDYVKARMEEQIAYLYEYQSMLGQMRKELPPLDKAQGNGWKLAATAKPGGDSKAKKMASSSAKLLDKMANDYKGTPWEVLAKREKLTTLGLEWKTATVK